MSTSKGVALITGSAQGIGLAIALRLAKDGFDIALNDVPTKLDQLRVVAGDIEKQFGRKTQIVLADVTIESEVKEMVQSVAQHLGGLDVMVANAGISPLADLISATVDDWERVMAVNARGVFLCYKYAAVQMIAQGRGGRIIGASSVAGKAGMALASAYCASKFAVRGLTQCAALELGRHKITVNAYAPTLIKTPMTIAYAAPGGPLETADPHLREWNRNYFGSKPIKEEGQPEDVASIVSYLASKEAHFITGQCVGVDGGLVMS